MVPVLNGSFVSSFIGSASMSARKRIFLLFPKGMFSLFVTFFKVSSSKFIERLKDENAYTLFSPEIFATTPFFPKIRGWHPNLSNVSNTYFDVFSTSKPTSAFLCKKRLCAIIFYSIFLAF